jgi:hypothetical protein
MRKKGIYTEFWGEILSQIVHLEDAKNIELYMKMNIKDETWAKLLRILFNDGLGLYVVKTGVLLSRC